MKNCVNDSIEARFKILQIAVRTRSALNWLDKFHSVLRCANVDGCVVGRNREMHCGNSQADRLAAEAIVVGAGPAGLTAAMSLAATGVDVLVAAPAYVPARSEADRRTTALLPGSIQLLENLGVWGTCAAQSAPLEGVRIIDDRGGLLRAPEVLFKARELGLACLGANIPNAALNAALNAAATNASGLRRVPTAAAVGMEIGPDFLEISFAEGGKARGRLAIAADGRNSTIRAAARIVTRTWSYGQVAIAAVFRHSRAHANVTTEFHRRPGPLTVVPLPGDASSLVWVETAAEAKRLAALEEKAFLVELSARLHGLLGDLGELSPRAVFPLMGLQAEYMARARTALVGEAAHVIPPIGAQGLNLGLRDAAYLAECVGAARAVGDDIGADATLEAYRASRTPDILSRTISVDLLNRSLLFDFLPMQALRGLGLHLLANAGVLRRLLMRSGLDAPGDAPRLMRPGNRHAPLDAGAATGQSGLR
jgi:2-octaprenyl-6-methoxyphenol hydroxylase